MIDRQRGVVEGEMERETGREEGRERVDGERRERERGGGRVRGK